MNDSHFESTLRAFRPSAPSSALEERIAGGLLPPEQTEPSPAKKEREPVSIRFEQAREPLLIRCFHSLGWAIAGAASAVAAIALFPAKPAPEKPATHAVQISASTERGSPGEERALSDAPSSDGPSSATRVSSVSTVPVADSLPAGSGDTADFQSLETTRELVSSEEEGQVIYRNGESPMRQVRNRYRERHSWTNPRTGARVDIEIPREDVFLKPVSLQ